MVGCGYAALCLRGSVAVAMRLWLFSRAAVAIWLYGGGYVVIGICNVWACGFGCVFVAVCVCLSGLWFRACSWVAVVNWLYSCGYVAAWLAYVAVTAWRRRRLSVGDICAGVSSPPHCLRRH